MTSPNAHHPPPDFTKAAPAIHTECRAYYAGSNHLKPTILPNENRSLTSAVDVPRKVLPTREIENLSTRISAYTWRNGQPVVGLPEISGTWGFSAREGNIQCVHGTQRCDYKGVLVPTVSVLPAVGGSLGPQGLSEAKRIARTSSRRRSRNTNTSVAASSCNSKVNIMNVIMCYDVDANMDCRGRRQGYWGNRRG